MRDSLLVAIEQPDWERLLVFKFEHAEFGTTHLVAELIGRWANVLLLRPAGKEKGKVEHGERRVESEEWRVLECVHRYRPQDGASRPALPGQLYAPPPAQTGWPPDTLTEHQLRQVLDEAPPDAPLWRVLVDGLLGLSPQMARELVFRALGNAQAKVEHTAEVTPILEAVAGFADLLQSGGWQPCLARDKVGNPVAFAPYLLTYRTDVEIEPIESISLAVERFYGERTQTAGDQYATARRQVASSVERAAKALRRRQEAIQRELRSPEEIARLRASGEWILALATQIAPRQTELRLPAEVAFDAITLDPALSPADNAAAYFKRYRKAKRGLEMNRGRVAAVAAELAYVEQLAADLGLAADRGEIDAVRSALVDAGYLRQPSPPSIAPAKGPRRVTSSRGLRHSGGPQQPSKRANHLRSGRRGRSLATRTRLARLPCDHSLRRPAGQRGDRTPGRRSGRVLFQGARRGGSGRDDSRAPAGTPSAGRASRHGVRGWRAGGARQTSGGAVTEAISLPGSGSLDCTAHDHAPISSASRIAVRQPVLIQGKPWNRPIVSRATQGAT